MSFKRWFSYTVNIAFTSAGQILYPTLRTTSEYDFVIEKITGINTTGDFTVRVINSELQWANLPVQAACLLGTALYPNILLEPIKIPKNSNVTLECVNGATAVNSIQIVFEGYLIKDLIPNGRLWYQYVNNVTFTAANQQAIVQVNVASHKNFTVQKFLAKYDSIDFQLDIIDANDKWTQNYTKAANIIGSVNNPNILLTPIFVPANSTINVQLINGATAANIIQLCMEGFLE